MSLPGRRTTKMPASFAASKMGWRARQSLKSTTPREGFVAATEKWPRGQHCTSSILLWIRENDVL